MKAILVTFKTQQPVLATSFQGDPNSDVSYPYIPGSMIRGAVIGRYMKFNNLSDLDLTNAEIRRVFFDGTFYLNAYLISKGRRRTLPIPRSLFKDKNAEITESNETLVFDFSQIEVDDRDQNLTPKPLNYDFCTVENELITPDKIERRINIHNFRDRQKGRSNKDQGGIFRYDAIDAGQTFQAIIICEHEDLDLLQKLFDSENIWFGGSQSAGYGHCKISKVEVFEQWNEVGIKESDRTDRDYLTITLLSDTILKNECGQYVANPLLVKQEIESKLGHELQFKEHGIYSSSTLIGGFNRKWGLPLPQIQAFEAGSVFVFEKNDITQNQIQQLEQIGIGERQVEGFGRIAINWLEELEIFHAQLLNPEKISLLPLSSSSQIIAIDIANKLFKKRLEQHLLKRLNDGDTNINFHKFYISNSQLSRLAIVAIQGLQSASLEPLWTLLDSNNLTKNALIQFQRTEMESGESFYEKLKSWLANPKNIINNLPGLELAITNEIQQNLTDELAVEYTLKLIVAVAKKAMKEKDND